VLISLLLISNMNVLLGFAIAAELGRRSRRAAVTASTAGLEIAPRVSPTAARSHTSAPVFPKSFDPPVRSASVAVDVGPLLARLATSRTTYQEAMVSADEQLRQCLREPRQAELATCLRNLSEANQRYLREQDAWRVELDAISQKAPEAINGALLAALDIQRGQIAAAQRMASEMNLEDDLEAECRRVMQETHRLAIANHRLRDAAHDQRLSAGPSAAATAADDELTGLPHRDAIDAALQTWLNTEPARRDPLCLALFDIDEFGPFNQRQGQRCGDHVLRALAKLLKTESPPDALVAKCAGETFAVLLRNHDIRQAGQVAERFRQLVEQASFAHEGNGLRLPVSCAAVEASAAHSVASLQQRALETLREAKRYGRNRCFVNEGRYPTPVEPAVFAIEPRNLELQ
jgi:diguanylate cyclase (GGDEF)-like protein